MTYDSYITYSMRGLRIILLTCLLLLVVATVRAQDTDNLPEHTPEHEAAKQTETLQREIKLSPEQAKLIYEINLKYAYERKHSDNRREQAIERLKNKSNDYKKVLTEEQYHQLENRRLGIYTHQQKTTLNTSYRTISSITHPADTIRGIPHSSPQPTTSDSLSVSNDSTVRMN